MSEHEPAKAIDPAQLCMGLGVMISALTLVKDRKFFQAWAPAAIAGMQAIYDRTCGDRVLFGSFTAEDQHDIELWWTAAGCPCEK